MQIEILNIVIDLTPLFAASDRSPMHAIWYIFANGGWVLFVLVFIIQGYYLWLQGQQFKWFKTNKFTLLAVDIPKEHEQTPKAVEQLFSTISGAHAPLSKTEEQIKGVFQLAFSFEIVSIDGYVQFLIHTATQYRDLVESSIYAQYPDAEITEVDDYATWAPEEFPDETHNIWGTEVILTENQAFPIKTYPAFEDKVSGEYKDPLAAMLETMSKVQVGEQVWFQIIVKPTGFEWVKESERIALKLAGRKVHEPTSKPNQVIDWITNTIDNIGEFILPLWKEVNEKDELVSMMLHLTPGEKNTLEAIQNKSSKMGFECKIRLVYLSTNEQFSPNRAVSGVFGSIKQFADLTSNGFKPDPKTKTSIMYWFTKYRAKKRKARLVKAYKLRSTIAGYKAFILNTEELATLWHFPGVEIRTPLLRRTETKKGEPPTSLPASFFGTDSDESETANLSAQLKQPSEFNVDLDNDYFEKKFAKDKTKQAENTITPSKNSTINASAPKGGPPSNLPL
ncbi:hypothetical protein HOD19_00045 [bacterium]|jgi:hypothetical protein|nr:hypothetical protein [bacterium]MBT4649232.1 hypothetical protein [bacterium]